VDDFADNNTDNKVKEHEQDQGVDVIGRNKSGESEGATGTVDDIMGVKLVVKMVEDELLHPDHPKKEEEGGAVGTRKAETGKAKIITI